MENFNEKIAYEKAKKRVKEIRSFYINLTCYLIVIPILICVNLIYMPEFQWFWFSMLGWGIGLTFHGIQAFDFMPFLGRDWEERKLREFMEKEEQKRQSFKR